jgi:hypothetical protein
VDVAPAPDRPAATAEPAAEPIAAPTAQPKGPPKESASKKPDAPAPLPPLQGPSASSGGTATATPAGTAQIAQLTGLAATDAQGLTPAGSTLAATFKAGDTMEAPLLLQPGRCFTILAAGAPTVQQIDISLMMNMPMGMPSLPTMVLAQGSGTQTAALGGKSNCFRYPLPIPAPANIVVKVVSGSGVVAVQVYGK